MEGENWNTKDQADVWSCVHYTTDEKSDYNYLCYHYGVTSHESVDGTLDAYLYKSKVLPTFTKTAMSPAEQQASLDDTVLLCHKQFQVSDIGETFTSQKIAGGTACDTFEVYSTGVIFTQFSYGARFHYSFTAEDEFSALTM